MNDPLTPDDWPDYLEQLALDEGKHTAATLREIAAGIRRLRSPPTSEEVRTMLADLRGTSPDFYWLADRAGRAADLIERLAAELAKAQRMARPPLEGINQEESTMQTNQLKWPQDGSGGQTHLDTSVPAEGASFQFTTPATLNTGAGWVFGGTHPDGANPSPFAGSFGVVGADPLMTWGGGAIGQGTTVNFRGSPKTGGKKDKHHDIVLAVNTTYHYDMVPDGGTGDHPVRVTLQKPKKGE